MYTPQAFEITDSALIKSFVSAYGFGILISTHDAQIETTHTPMYTSEDLSYVFGHLAKGNPQWKSWSSYPSVRVLFHGPHVYISPGDYASGTNVPTWNYTAIVIDGMIELFDATHEKLEVLEHLLDQYELAMDTPWKLDASDKKMKGLLNAIVGFRVRVQRVTAKFKLNQNKRAEDQRCVVARLKDRGGEMNLAIAKLMEKNLAAASPARPPQSDE